MLEQREELSEGVFLQEVFKLFHTESAILHNDLILKAQQKCKENCVLHTYFQRKT